MKGLEADGMDVKEDVENIMLHYYSGIKSYTLFDQPRMIRFIKRHFVHGRNMIKRR